MQTALSIVSLQHNFRIATSTSCCGNDPPQIMKKKYSRISSLGNGTNKIREIYANRSPRKK